MLWQLITAPEGTAAGLARLSPTDRVSASALVVDDERLSAVERIDVYADMYFYRILEALKEDFAAVCAVVGEGNFHNLVTDYLIVHPPSHFSLRYAGAHLPSFLLENLLSQRWPYVADLASLEWNILDAFDAQDAPALDPQALASVPQDRWPELRFQATPSVRLLDVRWPVHEIWKRTQRGEPPAEPVGTALTLRVWRQDFRVYHRPVDATERAGLMAILEGASFAEVCERITAFADQAHGADRVGARAFTLLSEWLGDGLLSAFSLPPATPLPRPGPGARSGGG